jgi:hypothetical protein
VILRPAQGATGEPKVAGLGVAEGTRHREKVRGGVDPKPLTIFPEIIAVSPAGLKGATVPGGSSGTAAPEAPAARRA